VLYPTRTRAPFGGAHKKQSTRGRATLAGILKPKNRKTGRFFLGVRHFLLMLHASAQNRDWVEGCIESRSPSPPPRPKVPAAAIEKKKKNA
jgi:hypothetical protein